MISDIRAALTRKLGPLPAWAWLAIFAGAVFLWRRGHGGSTASAATTDTGNGVDLTPPEPQDPITLQPGESVYNPATGQLIASPVPLPTEPVVPAEVGLTPTNPIEDAPAATAANATGVAPPTKKLGPIGRARAAVANAGRGGRIGPKNRQRLHTGGYTDRQIDYHLKRGTPLGKPSAKQHPKPKAGHKTPTPVKHPTAQKPRSRSHAVIRHPTARPKPSHAPAHPKPRPAPKPAPPALRPRAKVTHAPVQRQRPAPAPATPHTSTPTRKKKKK